MKTALRKQLGFTIIETLIALLVMGVGILSLAGMQSAILRNVDISQQRTEATRLAQEKMEALRSYTGISSTTLAATTTTPSTVSASALNWTALSSSSDTATTNATFTRTWTLGGATTDGMRAITVTVAWTDRAGEAQSVTLASVLSQTNPADSGYLGFPLPQNTNLKRPLNRNLDIPIPSIDLGNGSSAVKFGTSGQYVSFNNVSGDVVSLCTPILVTNPTTAQVIAALTSTTSSISNCTTITGYVVTGYIGKDSSMSTSDWSAISSSLGMETSNLTRNAAGTTAISCQLSDAVDQNSGATIADTKSYICVIPLSAPTPALTSSGPYNWSGTMRIAGPAVWHSSGNKYYACRYQYSSTNTLTDVNKRNVQPYVNVNLSIDQQNYLIATTNTATTTTAPTCPTSMTVSGISTGVLHQDCRSASNASYANTCPLLGATTSYTVTYNSNGALTGSAPTDANSPYSSGATVTVLGNTGAMTKTGYSFSGWNTLSNGTGTAYTAASTFTITANTTLYAQWSALPTYTITYQGNGNDGSTVAPTDSNSPYTSGSVVTILSSGTLTKSGYSFSNWNTAANGTGTSYSAGTSLVLSSNTVLYAQWTVLPTYTVTYSGNGNTGGTVPASASYTSGNTVTVSTNSGTLSKTNNIFNGWVDGSGTTRSVSSTFTITSNTTLTAVWTLATLSTPAPAWPSSGTDPRTLSWSAITGATDYLVSSCSLVNSNTTSCTPTGSSSQTGTSITPPALGTKDTRCYSVIATGSPYTNSASSSTKCVNRIANGNYSYP